MKNSVPLMFVLRRLALVGSIFLLEDYLSFQFILLTYATLGQMCFIMSRNLYESKFMNRMESFNEWTFISILLVLMSLSGTVEDLQMQSNLGFAFLGITGINIGVNMFIMIISSCKKLRLSIRRLC